MDLILEEKDAADWVYRGEGAANIVLAYTGSSPSFIGKVLRIQKIERKGSNRANVISSFSVHERLLWKDNEELISSPNNEIAGQLYVQVVMSPLLGSKHVDAGTQVLVSKHFLQAVDKNVKSQRPGWRINSTMVNLLRESALMISDHSLFPLGTSTSKGHPCISVEIKPKCGFLPSSGYIGKRNAIKWSTTRFKMHQLLKLYKKQILKISKYDPLDLFSGSRSRIYEALSDLYETPQNNFRVFMNGSLVLGALGGNAGSTSTLMGQALEDALKFFIEGDDGMRTKGFLELLAETIHKSRVLDQLLEVQKLDSYDIEGAIHAYYNITSQPCVVCRELDEDEVSLKFARLHSLPLDDTLKIVKNFLIAATAKDCSLIFCFRRREDGEPESLHDSVYLDSTNQVFYYKVFFIDLDLKPLEKMEYYYKLDQKIVNFYMEMVAKENAPEEDGHIMAYENAQ